MPRNRIISASEALFVGQSPATGSQANIYQLHRVQSCTQAFNVNRQNVGQFGLLSPISREINEAPTVSLDFSYYLTNVYNEQKLGFVVDGSSSAITNLLNGTENEKNYYLGISAYGVDADGDVSGKSVIAVGNGFLSSYSTEAAVNGFPTSTVRVEGLNIASYVSASGQITPAVNPINGSRGTGLFTLPTAVTGIVNQVPVLKHGDITLNFSNPQVGVDITDAKIQRYTLSFNLAREPLEKIGSKFAFSRELTFPINVTLSVDANVGDITSGSLSDILCNDQSYNLSIILRKPVCTGVGEIAASFSMINAKMDSQSFNDTIGPSKSVTMQWSNTLGGPQDVTNGLFISGSLT